MEHCNGLPTPTKVESPPGTDVNGAEANRDWPNSYSSFISMLLYLASNTGPYIPFDFHQFSRFTQNNKAPHKTSMKMIFHYLQVTQYNGIMFNPSKKLVVNCYADTDFAGL